MSGPKMGSCANRKKTDALAPATPERRRFGSPSQPVPARGRRRSHRSSRLTAGQKREHEAGRKRDAHCGERILANGGAQLLGRLRQLLAACEAVAALLVEVRRRRGSSCADLIEMGLRNDSLGAFQRLLRGSLGAFQRLLRSRGGGGQRRSAAILRLLAAVRLIIPRHLLPPST